MDLRRVRPVASGWRLLGMFWAVVLLVVSIGATVLQVLGPPPRPPPPPPLPRPAPPLPRPAAAPPAASAPQPSVTEVARSDSPVSQRATVAPQRRPGRSTPGPTADPDPALLEAAPNDPAEMLPRIAADGRMPMQVYAAGFDPSSRRPRIGVIVAGIGMNRADSVQAVRSLPKGVTFAISPYAGHLEDLLSVIRLADAEYLVSVPMEPQSFPLNDAGPHALMTNLPREENQARLYWALSRLAGYVGVTNALGPMQGERFAGVPEQINPILAEVGRRGLLYVDARRGGAGRPGDLPHVWSRGVDLVIDQPATQIDQNLVTLEHLAHEQGSALGLAGAPMPKTVQRIAVWADRLIGQGLTLAPVSALVVPPSDQASGK